MIFIARVTIGLLLSSAGLVSRPLFAAKHQQQLSLQPRDVEPTHEVDGDRQAQIKVLRKKIAAAPKERKHRFDLVRLLMADKQFETALVEATAWRDIDAYNLVVVRLIGDILTELGRKNEARRVYSAVVEMLPKNAGAHRALATVLKQAGDTRSAYERLKQASALRPEDQRLMFEMADAAERVEKGSEAEELFKTVIDADGAPEGIRYPAKQRLASLLNKKRVTALKAADTSTAENLSKEIASLKVKGGAVNDIKIYLTWDTDGSDVDLWVTNPAGQKVFYSHKVGRFGGTLYHDVTNGYGPESFTATKARRGAYLVQVNYFGTNRSSFPEARGEVTVILNEGRVTEQRFRLPYRLFKPKQTVTVAEINVTKE